jgi:nitrile hydratase
VDGPHDLGGRQGFGRVETDEKVESFHEAWEARAYGLVKAMTRQPDWSIDWFRHCRELIEPVDYLTRPYYDQWMQSYGAMLVVSGAVTLEELVSGKADSRLQDVPAPMSAQDVKSEKKTAINAEVRSNIKPAFEPGDRVATGTHGIPGHTRLPGYLRGRTGVIEAYRGVHILPDAHAVGDDRAEPLYTVGFKGEELWPEAKGRRDTIFADLWESYLVGA